jgi:serine/threonine-protein kinase
VNRSEDTGYLETTPAASADADRVLADFRLLAKIGEGAMGVVYKAHQLSFERTVALKVLFPHIAAKPKLLERFYREARLTGSLDHPHIVQGFGVGEDQGWHYYVMEYVSGQSLQQWLNHEGRLSVGTALHIVRACASALEYAHHLNLVHRDVKPDNILISRRGEVKLADLGMVKFLEEDMAMTETGHAVGTPWYMPLEQARNGKDADARSDIYALGCVLYCLLTGRPPFAGRTIVDVIQAKEVGTFPPARHTNPDVPVRLDLLIGKMTAKHPRHRHQSSAEVLQDLEALDLAHKRLLALDKEGTPPERGSTDEIPIVVPQRPATRSPVGPPVAKPQDAPAVWFVRYQTSGGRQVIRKMTEGRLLQLIAGRHFDPRTMVRRASEGDFRALATYGEFASAVLGGASRRGLAERSSRYRALFKNITKETRPQQPPRRCERIATTFRSWLGMLVQVMAVGAGVVGLVLLAILLFRWLSPSD